MKMQNNNFVIFSDMKHKFPYSYDNTDSLNLDVPYKYRYKAHESITHTFFFFLILCCGTRSCLHISVFTYSSESSVVNCSCLLLYMDLFSYAAK
jgi:hypothetical protein